VMLVGVFFLFQAEDGIRVFHVTGVQTCALPIYWLHAFVDQTEKADSYQPIMEETAAALLFSKDDYHLVFGQYNTTLEQLKGNHRSEEHTSELQSRENLVCRLLLEKKNLPLQ